MSSAKQGFVARLTARAQRIAAAHAENRRRAPTRDPARWRRAALLWPNFTGEV